MRNMHYEALSHLYEAANKVSTDEFDSEELDIALNHARSALSLPTANHIPDAGKMVETAAPVDERTAFEALFRERYGWDAKDFKRDSRGDYMDGNTVTAWMSWQARAALREKGALR